MIQFPFKYSKNRKLIQKETDRLSGDTFPRSTKKYKWTDNYRCYRLCCNYSSIRIRKLKVSISNRDAFKHESLTLKASLGIVPLMLESTNLKIVFSFTFCCFIIDIIFRNISILKK